MNGQSRWELLIELLDEASNLPVQEQQRFLERRTPDIGLRQDVQSLLKVSVPANDIIERCAYEWYTQLDAGQVSPPTPRLAAGEILAARFKITTFLGRGGMGEVFAALDIELGENVALKLLHAELATQPAFVERFRREIRLARRISHPNVARVFDLVLDRAHPLGPFIFYVMELLPGESLAHRLKRAGPLPPGEALEIARQMASGLSAAHQAGVIHRDFKPANVMLHEGRGVITDFGLATALERSAGSGTSITTSLLLGTPGYMAPEQWTGKSSSVASDVYAFGVVLHEMVCGKHPNVAEHQTPEPWKKAVTKCMEMEPRNRWRTPLEAVAALEPRFWNRRNWLSTAAAAGVVSLGTVGLRLYYRSAKPSRGFSMVVPDVENATGDMRLDGIGTALRAQLDQSTYFNVVQLHALTAVCVSNIAVSPGGVKAKALLPCVFASPAHLTRLA